MDGAMHYDRDFIQSHIVTVSAFAVCRPALIRAEFVLTCNLQEQLTKTAGHHSFVPVCSSIQ